MITLPWKLSVLLSGPYERTRVQDQDLNDYAPGSIDQDQKLHSTT